MAFGLGEAFVVAALHDASVVEDHYLVGVAHGGETVGHDHYRASTVEVLEVIHDGAFVGSVEGVGGFVEYDEFGILVDGAGYEYTLLLSEAQPDAVTPDAGAVAAWQLHDEVVDAGGFGCELQSVEVYLLVLGGNVARYRFGEYDTVLHDHAAFAAPLLWTVFAQIRAAERQASLEVVEIVEHELDECGLAAARCSHYRRHLALGDVERYVGEGVGARVGVILECQVLKPDVAIGNFEFIRSLYGE